MTSLPVHLPLVTAFGDTPDILHARLAAAAAGTLPHGYRTTVTTKEIGFDDLTADDACLGSVREAGGERWQVLLGGEDWMLLVSRSSSRFGFIAQAATAASARLVTDTVLARMRTPETENSGADMVPMEFCHVASRGLQLSRRSISCPAWPELAGNYPAGGEAALSRLAGLREPSAGRLILLWGAPGTGKTTAVRALARRWADWCRTTYVLDPEHLFSSSDYFHELLIAGERSFDDDESDDVDTTAPPWRLLVIEDADEVVRADAKQRSGQALSRLLNLTDGIVGQGMRTLVLITTNEPVTELHPALTRPGRCLAQIEIGPLDPSEVQAWWQRNGHDPRTFTGAATLAELYAAAADSGPVEARPVVLGGDAGYL